MDFFDLIKYVAIIIIVILALDQLGVFRLIGEAWEQGVNDFYQYLGENWLGIAITIAVIIFLLYVLYHFDFFQALIDFVEGTESGGV